MAERSHGHGSDTVDSGAAPTVGSTVAGVAVVTIPVVEYAALQECRRLAGETQSHASRFMKPGRSPIERDTDVAVFLAEHFGVLTLSEIIDECRRRFGASRTPSLSSAHRYWCRLRAMPKSEWR